MSDFITEQTPLEHSRSRAYDPVRGSIKRERGEDDNNSGHSSLVSECTGDWSWKPARDKALGDAFVTFRGNPPGAAETHGRTLYHVR